MYCAKLRLVFSCVYHLPRWFLGKTTLPSRRVETRFVTPTQVSRSHNSGSSPDSQSPSFLFLHHDADDFAKMTDYRAPDPLSPRGFFSYPFIPCRVFVSSPLALASPDARKFPICRHVLCFFPLKELSHRFCPRSVSTPLFVSPNRRLVTTLKDFC